MCIYIYIYTRGVCNCLKPAVLEEPYSALSAGKACKRVHHSLTCQCLEVLQPFQEASTSLVVEFCCHSGLPWTWISENAPITPKNSLPGYVLKAMSACRTCTQPYSASGSAFGSAMRHDRVDMVLCSSHVVHRQRVTHGRPEAGRSCHADGGSLVRCETGWDSPKFTQVHQVRIGWMIDRGPDFSWLRERHGYK